MNTARTSTRIHNTQELAIARKPKLQAILQRDIRRVRTSLAQRRDDHVAPDPPALAIFKFKVRAEARERRAGVDELDADVLQGAIEAEPGDGAEHEGLEFADEIHQRDVRFYTRDPDHGVAFPAAGVADGQVYGL